MRRQSRKEVAKGKSTPVRRVSPPTNGVKIRRPSISKKACNKQSRSKTSTKYLTKPCPKKCPKCKDSGNAKLGRNATCTHCGRRAA